MNLVDALRKKVPLRRPVAKHLGSGGNGWLHPKYVLALLTASESQRSAFPTGGSSVPLVAESDILADDWEVRDVEESVPNQ